MIDIRPGTDEDRPRILARIEEVFGPEPAQRTDRLWHWQWHLDPRLESPGYKGIVAEWRDEIIGNLGTIPAGLHIGGEPVDACWCVDAFVHWGSVRRALREQRRGANRGSAAPSKGIANALFDHPAAPRIQLGKHISDDMRAIVQRIGFEPQPESGSLHRRVSLRHTIGGAVGAPLGALLGGMANLWLPRIGKPGMPVRVLAGAFDERFDALWEQARSRYPAITRRDSNTLEWRYRQHPANTYDVLVAESNGELRGYAVLLRYARDGRRRAKLVDLLAAPEDADALRSLVAGSLRFLRAHHVERVETFASGPAASALFRNAGFTERLTKSEKPQPMVARRFPGTNPYVTQGDGDGG